jgi:hypothetical protein
MDGSRLVMDNLYKINTRIIAGLVRRGNPP